MRRPLSLLLAVGIALALVLSGCGSSSPGAPADPLASVLSYFPAQTPFVLTLATQPSPQAAAQVSQIEQRIPLVSLETAAVISRLKQLGVDYDQDVKPLLGNPIAIGDPRSSFAAFRDDFLIAWVTKDASKLHSLLNKVGDLTPAGEHDQAKLYTVGSSAIAVTGHTLLFAKATSDLINALDRHAHGGGVTSSQYQTAVSGLPQDATVHIFGDVAGLLSTPQAAKARLVPWVRALRSYAATFGSSTAGLTIQFRLNTSGAPLTANQLPFATGTTPAKVVAGLPIQTGIRNPSQIFNFIEGAERATDPAAYAKFLKQQAVVRRRTGIDVNTLVSQFQGDLVVDSDTHVTLVRAAFGDPGTVTSVLSKMASARGGLGGSATLKSVGGGLYSFAPSGHTGLLTVIGDQLVFGVAPRGSQMKVSTLHAFASAPGRSLPGANGAVSFRVGLAQLLTLTASSQTSSPLARQILNLLGDFSGSASVTLQALTGSATLAIK